jgi:hypothetical protein
VTAPIGGDVSRARTPESMRRSPPTVTIPMLSGRLQRNDYI